MQLITPHILQLIDVIFIKRKWRVAISSEPRANKHFEMWKLLQSQISTCNKYIFAWDASPPPSQTTYVPFFSKILTLQSGTWIFFLLARWMGEEVEAALASDQISMMFGRVPSSLWWIIISPRWPYGAADTGQDLKSLICCPRNSQMCSRLCGHECKTSWRWKKISG